MGLPSILLHPKPLHYVMHDVAQHGFRKAKEIPVSRAAEQCKDMMRLHGQRQRVGLCQFLKEVAKVAPLSGYELVKCGRDRLSQRVFQGQHGSSRSISDRSVR